MAPLMLPYITSVHKPHGFCTIQKVWNFGQISSIFQLILQDSNEIMKTCFLDCSLEVPGNLKCDR